MMTVQHCSLQPPIPHSSVAAPSAWSHNSGLLEKRQVHYAQLVPTLLHPFGTHGLTAQVRSETADMHLRMDIHRFRNGDYMRRLVACLHRQDCGIDTLRDQELGSSP